MTFSAAALPSDISALVTLADALPQIVFIDNAEGTPEYWNKRWYDYTGLTAAQSIGPDRYSIVHPDDRTVLATQWPRSIKTGEPFEFECRMRRASDGAYRWHLSRAVPVRDQGGRIVRWYGTLTDIDDQKHVEQALVESERLFRKLAEVIPAMVWITDSAGRLRYANGQWMDFFNYSNDTLDAWRMRQHLHPDDFPHSNARWKLSLETGVAYEVEYRARDRHGRYEWFLVRAHPVHDNAGNVVQWFGTSTSIDQQKRAYERQRMVADTLQEAFIPKVLPQIDGVTFDAAYFAAQIDSRIGGDWYDATVIGDGQIVFSIGDVCGHGLEAAITMGRVRQTIISAAAESRDPGTVLEKVNRILLLQEAPMVTAIVGFIDLENRMLRIASAGHPPAVIVAAGKTAAAGRGGIPLGILRDARYISDDYRLDVETFVGLYTDGLIEARRTVETDELLALRTMEEAARGDISATGIRERVLDGTASSDDVAILTIRISA